MIHEQDTISATLLMLEALIISALKLAETRDHALVVVQTKYCIYIQFGCNATEDAGWGKVNGNGQMF